MVYLSVFFCLFLYLLFPFYVLASSRTYLKIIRLHHTHKPADIEGRSLPNTHKPADSGVEVYPTLSKTSRLRDRSLHGTLTNQQAQGSKFAQHTHKPADIGVEVCPTLSQTSRLRGRSLPNTLTNQQTQGSKSA